MAIEDGAQPVPAGERLAARGREAADNARWAAANVVGVLDARRRRRPTTLAVSLIDLLDLVEHARRENPGMRGSELLPKGGASPARRPVEMLLRGVYSVKG